MRLVGHRIDPADEMIEGQKQQSSEDIALTQKVGKMRITIEQNNGQMKISINFFDNKIKIKQIALANRIFRSSFLLTNFKLPFIQERSDVAPKTSRPCKAEVRLYGGTDDGLVDVRPQVALWGLEPEIERWHELRARECNKTLMDTEVSEIVFEEDWPAKLQKLHIEKLTID